jgi:hypothetical protein
MRGGNRAEVCYVEVSEGEDREKRVRLGGCFQVNGAEEKLFLSGGQPPKGAGRRPKGKVYNGKWYTFGLYALLSQLLSDRAMHRPTLGSGRSKGR